MCEEIIKNIKDVPSCLVFILFLCINYENKTKLVAVYSMHTWNHFWCTKFLYIYCQTSVRRARCVSKFPKIRKEYSREQCVHVLLHDCKNWGKMNSDKSFLGLVAHAHSNSFIWNSNFFQFSWNFKPQNIQYYKVLTFGEKGNRNSNFCINQFL